MSLALGIGRLQLGNKTLFEQAYSILRRFGSDAHVYLPGIGIISGLQAANYLDSVGTTLATVDSPVGLVLDAMGSVGVELVSNPSFSSGGTGWSVAGWVLATGSASCTSLGTGNLVYQTGLLSSGKVYQFTYTVSSVTLGGVCAYANGNQGPTRTAAGTYTETLSAASTNNYVAISTVGITTATVTNISVREVTGIHATQATTAAKPRLERGVRNLLTYSQDFTNAAWIKVASTITTGQLDPLGGTNATALFETVASSLHQIEQTPAAVTSGVPYTVYAIVKDIGRGYFGLYENGSGKGNFYSIPADGSGSALGALVSAPTGASIASMGNGWYLAALNITTISTTLKAQVLAAQNATTFSYAGDVAKGLYVYRAGATAGTLTAQQILNEGGIPLTTTAAASNPNAGKYSWYFDGGDSLALGSVPFQMSDDHFVIGAINPNNTSAQVLYSQNGLTNPRLQLYVASNTARCDWQDDAAVLSGPNVAGAVPPGAMAVVAMRKIGNVKGVSVNGGADTTNSTVVGTTTFLTAKIGINSVNGADANYVNGSMGAMLVGKGTLSDSEYLTLKRLVANLTPNAPQF